MNAIVADAPTITVAMRNGASAVCLRCVSSVLMTIEGTPARDGFNPAPQIGQHGAARFSSPGDQRHGKGSVLRHREIDGGLLTPLEGPEGHSMHYPDDPGAAALVVDDRGPKGPSAEVEVGRFLIDHADTAPARYWIG
jgi:hypothetical protein